MRPKRWSVAGPIAVIVCALAAGTVAPVGATEGSTPPQPAPVGPLDPVAPRPADVRGGGVDAEGTPDADRNSAPLPEPDGSDVLTPQSHQFYGYTCDFNGDGYSEIPIPAPYERVGSLPSAGSVTILRGSSVGGKSAWGARVMFQGNGPAGRAEAGDLFGWRVLCGEFNGDVYDDLVISAPGESINGAPREGVVHVFYGSASGTFFPKQGTEQQLLYQGATVNGVKVFSSPERNDGFGSTLTSGDFDGDGYEDLAVGAPFETGTLSGESIQGLVHVFSGGANGLTPTRTFWGNSSTVKFGGALAAGNLDGDAYEELLIGTTQRDNLAGFRNAPVPAGDGPAGSTFMWVWRGTASGPGGPAFDDYVAYHSTGGFGSSIVTLDWNGDSYDDVLVGAPHTGFAGTERAGSIKLGLGGLSGCCSWTSGAEVLEMWQGGGYFGAYLPGADEKFDRYGWYLGAGDFNGDDGGDLVVGTKHEAVGSASKAGAVTISTAGRRQLLWQKQGLGGDGPETSDLCGHLLHSWLDVNGDGYSDLVVGCPGETIGGVRAVGSVHVLRGSANGVGTYATITEGGWALNGKRFPGDRGAFDQFGAVPDN